VSPISTLHTQTEAHNSLSIPLTLYTQAYTEQSSRLFEWDRGEGRGREGAGGERTGQDEMRQTEGRQKTSAPM